MSFKKQIMAVAAVTALSAATAVPAMALENEFHGVFRVRGIFSNFDDGTSGPANVVPPSNNRASFSRPTTETYIEQRLRLMYIAKANDDLKLVTHFEFDSRFGDNSYNSNGTTRNNGGGIGADQTNLETKNIYLDFNIPKTRVNVKAGIQGFTDAYKGIIFNNDAAGVVATGKLDNGSVNFGYFRFDDATTGSSTATNAYYTAPSAGSVAASNLKNNAQVGNLTRDFATVGGKLNVSKDVSVGADYYLLYSDVLKNSGAAKSYINMFGVNAAANIGKANVSGFALYQTGRMGGTVINTTATNLAQAQKLNAFAANLAGRMPIGPGTARITALYISGDSDPTTGERGDFQTIMERGNTTSGHTFFESNSMILLRHPQATAGTDKAVVFDLNNSAKGFIGAFAGYDLPLGKWFVNSTVGIGAVARDNSTHPNGITNSGSSNILGTELNTEVGYKLYDNLTASVQGAYLVLGDYFHGSTSNGGTPDNPYTTRVVLSYVF